MNVTLTSTAISDLSLTDERIHLNSITGLEVANIRTSSFENSGEDGGFVDSQFYGPRLISMTGVIDNGTCDGNLTGRSELISATPIRQDIDVDFATLDGRLLTAKGRVIGFNMPYTAKDRSEFKIDLFCEDPLLYDQSAGNELCIELERYVASGLEWPLSWPLQWGTGGGGAVTATNTGEATTYPLITLTGAMTNPTITNQTTGELFSLSLATTTDDVVVIDMRNRVVTLNGSSIFHLVSSQSTWWQLAMGGNDILFETTDSDDDVEANLCWLPAYLGV